MSTTLTNGLKLPDKGSVDWYADMQSNYAILDGAVGTVAEHTSQIAGKAPAVHTHTKSDITDFPVYGNAAGTICEGNDSRLSDARTPVAHTHVTADVTDLLNSAHTWSAENTYTNILLTLKHTALEVGVLPASNQTKRYRFTDKNNASLGWLQHRVNTSGDSYLEIYSVNRFSNEQLSPQGSDAANSLSIGLHSDGKRYAQVMSDFYPAYTNLNCNLGTSDNKWKTLNGINPGALSLPDNSSSISIDTTNWNVSGNFGNSYTPASNGWLHINIKDTATNSIFVYASNEYAASIYGNGSQGLDGRLALMMPVLSGVTYGIIIKAGSISEIYTAMFFPCQGNV